jgi:lipoprotein-releasing system permease protein
MFFPLKIALRYLFSKKSHNAINVISAVSAAGVAVGTAALIVVLSVFNGFEGLFAGMFSEFDPDLRITALQGKTFSIADTAITKALCDADIEVFTEVVEENALLACSGKQLPATVKGVSENFARLTRIDSIMFDGSFTLFDGAFERAVPGYGVAGLLGINAHAVDPLYIYTPKRHSNINMMRPEQSLNQAGVFVSGIFSVRQPQYDNHYVLVSIALARELFEYDSLTVTSVELKLKPEANIGKTQKRLKQILGSSFQVKNRAEQQESFFKIMNIERWFTFFILCFILMIASFNVIGSLSMLIIDKKNDINTLRSLGANNKMLKQIFLFEAWMISIVGAVAGLIAGTALCMAQEYFGFVKLGTDYVIESYPVMTNFTDILLVFTTVIIMGFLVAIYPVKYVKKDFDKTGNREI